MRSGVARIFGQGAPKKIRGGGGTSNKMKTEKKKTKYVYTHMRTQLVLFNCKSANTTNVKLNKRYNNGI
jgi:hypothetical protein